MRSLSVALVLSLTLSLTASPAIARMDDPDLEGPIKKIMTTKNEIVVKNMLTDSRVKNKEKRVLVKQGMINNYKMNDYVQVKLMADNFEAKQIDRIRPEEGKAAQQAK